MMRRLLDFIYILLFVWAFMLAGLWVIDSVIVPGGTSEILTGMLKVAASAGLVAIWLWTWRELVKRTFWHAVKKQHIMNENHREISTGQEIPNSSSESDEK